MSNEVENEGNCMDNSKKKTLFGRGLGYTDLCDGNLKIIISQ